MREYKKRREDKFNRNATLLREYQRAMKREGYDAGVGASRRRRGERYDGRGEGEDDDDDGVDGGKNAVVGGGRNERTIANDGEDDIATPAAGGSTPSTEEEGRSPKKVKRHRADPLHRAKKEAERRREERMEEISSRERKEEIDRARQNDRKVRTRKMMQRTRRGQPLMKNVIGDLLTRIKGEVDGNVKSA